MQVNPNDRLIVGSPSQAPEPKFLGARPAVSCCCGCSLQTALYVFSFFNLVFGGLAALGVLCGNVSVGNLLEALIGLGAGYYGWQAASRFDWEATKLYMLYCWVYLAYNIVVAIGIAVAATQLGTLLDEHWDEVRAQIEQAAQKKFTDEEANNLHHNLQRAAEVLAVLVPIVMALKTLMHTYFTYIVWSFKHRLERGDQGTILTGVEGSTAVLPAYMNTLPQPYATYANYPAQPPPHNPSHTGAPNMNAALPSHVAPYTATYNPVMFPGAAPVVSQQMGSVAPVQGGARNLSPTGGQQ